MNHKLESRLPGEISTTESEEELKNILKRVKEVSEKPGLKLSIQKNKILASSLITSWSIEGKRESNDILFSWAPNSLQMMLVAMELKDACSSEIKLWEI